MPKRKPASKHISSLSAIIYASYLLQEARETSSFLTSLVVELVRTPISKIKSRTQKEKENLEQKLKHLGFEALDGDKAVHEYARRLRVIKIRLAILAGIESDVKKQMQRLGADDLAERPPKG